MKPHKTKAARVKKIKRENAFFPPWIKATSSINDIYIFAKASRSSLIEYRQALIKSDKLMVEILTPTAMGNEMPQLSKRSTVTDVTKKAIRTGIFSNALVSMVAVTEGYFEETARIILKKYPQKLSVLVDKQNSVETAISVPLNVILSASSKEEIIEDMINRKLNSLSYAKPKDYFKYFETALSIKIDQDAIDNFVEIKASRDLIVHNGGRVNELYIRKSGNKCRTTNTKQFIPIDERYFLFATGIMKRLLKDCYECSSRVYLKKTRSRDLYP